LGNLPSPGTNGAATGDGWLRCGIGTCKCRRPQGAIAQPFTYRALALWGEDHPSNDSFTPAADNRPMALLTHIFRGADKSQHVPGLQK
jgi:hypothetical protein